MKKASPSFASNNRQMARVLGLKPTREQLAEIGDWRKHPGFPVKHKGDRGFRAAELREWYQKFIAEFSDATMDKLRELRAASLKALYAQGKPLNKDQKAELRLLGIAVGDEVGGSATGHLEDEDGKKQFGTQEIRKPDSNGNGLHEDLDTNCNTQADLAARLQRFYGNRISIIIDATAISDWRKGKRLDGAPQPPAKRGNYFITREWVEWFDAHLLARFILRHDAQGQLLPDLAVRSRDAEYMRSIHQEAILKLDLERRAGKFVEVDFVKRTVLPVIARVVNGQCVNTERLVLGFQNWLRSHGMDLHGAMVEWWTGALQAENRAWLDQQKKALATALAEADSAAKSLAEKN